MSLSQSLNIALSGLTAAARGAEVVAGNLSNKDVKSFGKRSLDLATATLGGVRVEGVQRAGNPVLIAERRLTQADAAATDSLLGFYKALEGWLGTPGAAGALGGRIDRLTTAFTAAAAEPATNARLAEVLDAAGALAQGLNQVSDQIQQARQNADARIHSDVELFNDALSKVAELNRTIARMAAQGQDVSGLVDQRQALVDQIADIVPLREVQRDSGQILLYSAGGATLLDGQPAVLGVQPAGVIRAESGPLPGLTLNGRPVSLGTGGPLNGGRLAADFALRDQIAPEAQAALDALAHDLIARVSAADTTRPPGSAGLFTDAGSAFDAAQERGIAGRISANTLVDPAAGGELWRLRAGLGAASPGEAGDGSLLTALSEALTAQRAPLAGPGSQPWQSLAGHAGAVLSASSTARLSLESDAAFASSRSTALTGMEAALGVDSDHELQMLLRIETAYAANARVIQTVDRMLATLLEL